MLLGINVDRERIRPAKGLIAWCELCGEELIPACGDINTHHWRHKNLKECDSWKENETDWHRIWKNYFPKDWLEVVIKRNLNVHRADIKTKAGLVVELQNSSISQSDILERELFYGNMIWLINANSFKENFHIRSSVNENLRKLDIVLNIQLVENSEIEEDLAPSFKYLEGQKEKLKDLKFEFESHDRKLADLIEVFESIDERFTQIYNRYIKSFPFNYLTPQIFHNLESESILALQKISDRLEIIESDLSKKTSWIRYINELPDFKIGVDSIFKIVSFNLVSPSSYTKCKVVKKETMNTLFPIIHDLNSPSNFNFYCLQERAYTLLINLSNDLSILLKEKNELELEMNDLLRNKESELKLLKKSMRKHLLKQIKESKKKISDIINGIEYQENEIAGIEIEIEEEKKRLEEESIEYGKMIRLKQDKDRSKIMKDKKGLYSYYWKYKRPSWNNAKAPIFLDFEKHIFKIISKTELRKISKTEFIKFVNEWKYMSFS